MTDENIARPSSAAYQQAGTAIARQGFGSQELERRSEQQSTVLAARATAEIQARYVVAMQRPRDLDAVRARLLRHCERKGFADRAEYSKPVGGGRVTGASVRFVETALAEYGNVLPESIIVLDDDDKRTERVSVTDLERNVTYSADVTVEKWVESLSPKQGDDVIGSRQNSSGRLTYKVRDTGDRFENKLAAAISKRIRNLGLRILPADLVDEALARAKATRLAEDVKDPDAERKRCADYYGSIGVNPQGLAEYLGHPLGEAVPAELDELRAIYSAIRDGEAKWTDAVAMKRLERGEIDDAKKPTAAATKLRERVEARSRSRPGATEPLPGVTVVPPEPSK